VLAILHEPLLYHAGGRGEHTRVAGTHGRRAQTGIRRRETGTSGCDSVSRGAEISFRNRSRSEQLLRLLEIPFGSGELSFGCHPIRDGALGRALLFSRLKARKQLPGADEAAFPDVYALQITVEPRPHLDRLDRTECARDRNAVDESRPASDSHVGWGDGEGLRRPPTCTCPTRLPRFSARLRAGGCRQNK
jgi:hypothetical protein